MPKSYLPSEELVRYLSTELQYLQEGQWSGTAAEGKSKGGRSRKGALTKKKADRISRIFQGFCDLVYFLEFIEAHPEMWEIYSNDLKDLFGVHSYLQGKANESNFSRFVSSALFNSIAGSKVKKTDEKTGNIFIESGQLPDHVRLDYRAFLVDILLHQSLWALEDRLTNEKECQLMSDDVIKATLWGSLLAGRARNEKERAPHRIFDFAPAMSSERKILV